MLEAAARFLEARPRSVARGPAAADDRPATGRSSSTPRSGGSASSATSTTTPSRGPGWSRATAPGRAASTRCVASSGCKGVDDAIVRTRARRPAAGGAEDRRQRGRRGPHGRRSRGGRSAAGPTRQIPRPRRGRPRRAVSGPTRCSRATGSTRRPPATWPAGSSTTARTSSREATATPTDRPRPGRPLRRRFGTPVVGYSDNRTRTRGPPPGEPRHRLRAGGASSAACPVPSPSDRRCGVART